MWSHNVSILTGLLISVIKRALSYLLSHSLTDSWLVTLVTTVLAHNALQCIPVVSSRRHMISGQVTAPQCARALVSWDWARSRSRSWLWAQVQAWGVRTAGEDSSWPALAAAASTGWAGPGPGTQQSRTPRESHQQGAALRGQSDQFRINFRADKPLYIVLSCLLSFSLSLSARSRGCLRVWLQSWDHVTRALEPSRRLWSPDLMITYF